MISRWSRRPRCRCPESGSRGTRGSVAVALAVALPIVVAGAGLAVDSGKMYVAHSALQNAVDASALAGSMELPYDPDMDKGLVAAAVDDMMAKNYPEATVKKVQPGGEVRSVCVTAEADVDMALMGVLGINEETVEASACAGFNNLEIALVIDTTGSMNGAPLNNTKDAAENLVDLVLPESGTASTKVGLAPFRGKVHLPAGVDGLEEGCRNVDGSLNDGSLLAVYEDIKYRNPRDWSLSQLGVPDDNCSNISMVKELTTDRDDILASINALTASGNASGTVISEGVKWGTHLLTPEAPYTQGADDDSYRKILIVLTDGDTEDGRCGGKYERSTTPTCYWSNAFFGVGLDGEYSSPDDIPTCKDGDAMNQAMLDEAQKAKDAGIEVFTIRYGTSDSTDESLMKQMASSKEGTDDHYFDAPSANDIDEVFKKIGQQLGLRLLPLETAMGGSS